MCLRDGDSISLRKRPLAAQIGGEVFSLRYTPFKDVDVHLLRYGEEMGRRVYERTLQFILIAAVRRLFPKARVQVRYSLGPGLYITIDKDPLLLSLIHILHKFQRLCKQHQALQLFRASF